MKKSIFLAIALAIPTAMLAQTAIDTYQLSRYDLRGTARYMSMGGAFGALGGDLSAINQNPGGIGIYRKSDIGFTLNFDIQNSKSTSPTHSESNSQVKTSVNNIGYVGVLNTKSELMPYFQWGLSYGRTASFNRRFHGVNSAMNSSLTNYIAGYTTDEGWADYDLEGSDANYFNYQAPWLAMLAYNAYMINVPNGSSSYEGLFQNGTTGVSTFDVEEKGYVDEFALNFGGNFTNTVYWGIGMSITDIEYTQNTYYTEDLFDARIPYQRPATNAELINPNYYVEDGQVVDGTTTGDGGFGMESFKRISGSGFNFKAGLIVRPINELRLGLAVHTPTYYNLSQVAYAYADYGYGYSSGPAQAYYSGTPDDYVQWKIRTPWRLMASAAAVIGPKAIVSVDYEYRPYQSMVTKNSVGNDYTLINDDIDTYYKDANIIRVGAEYRLSNNFSLRAGYAYESTPTSTEVRSGTIPVYTSNPDDSGLTPSYTLDNSTNYITCGLGWRQGGFYADAAYVYKSRSSEFMPFTPNAYTETPLSSKIDQTQNNIVLTIGYKF